MFKDGKIFGKINIFDFIVIILLVLLIFGALTFFGLRLLSDEPLIQNRELKEVEYTIVLGEVRTETVNAFNEGSLIYDAETKAPIGIVTEIKTTAATDIKGTFDGKAVNAPIEDRYRVTLTLKAIVSQTNAGDLWLTDRDRLLLGRTVSFINQIASCKGDVGKIEVLNDLGTLSGRFSDARDPYYSK